MALVAGAGVAFVGGLFPVTCVYNYAWFVGFAVGFTAYHALMPKPALIPEAAD